MAIHARGIRPLICPTCKRKLANGAVGNPYRPFCSERCRLVDLGAWLEGGHRISTPLAEADLDRGAATDSDDDEPPRRLD